MKQTHNHKFSLPRWLSRSGEKPSRSARLWFLVLAPLFAILLINSTVSAMTEGTIYPGVSVAGKDLGGLTRVQAYGALQTLPLARRYRITVDNKVFEATNDQIGANYDINSTVNLAYSIGRQSGLSLFGLFKAHDQGQLKFAYEIDYRQLQKFTSSIIGAVGKTPTNAAITIKEGSVAIVPDQPGLQIDRSQMTSKIAESLGSASDQAFEFKPQPVDAPISVAKAEPVLKQTTTLMSRKISYNYDGRNFSPSVADIGHWLNVQPNQEVNPSNLTLTIQEKEIRGYIQSLANQLNKNPVNKKVTISNGTTSTEREGQDGLAIDQESAAKATLAAMNANQDAVITLTATPVAYKTETFRTVSLDYGRYIEVNLASQHLWAYENGQVVYSSPVTSGATGAGLGTATGLFAIYYKTTNTYLNGRPYGYNYNVFVKYWMPFYLGYGLHDASWRSNFGGSDYFYGGSHGCVNLPEATAAYIYNWADVGTPVWVHT